MDNRELDAKAAHLMGCNPEWLKISIRPKEPFCRCKDQRHSIGRGQFGSRRYMRHYSTKIEDAWLLVEHFQVPLKSSFSVVPVTHMMGKEPYMEYLAKVELLRPEYSFEFATAPTAPEAITKAFIKAMEAK